MRWTLIDPWLGTTHDVGFISDVRRYSMTFFSDFDGRLGLIFMGQYICLYGLSGYIYDSMLAVNLITSILPCQIDSKTLKRTFHVPEHWILLWNDWEISFYENIFAQISSFRNFRNSWNFSLSLASFYDKKNSSKGWYKYIKLILI